MNFKEKGEVKEKREKFLTAKYGHHQMSLIRKRLAVEMWLYEELKKLYESTNVSSQVLDPEQPEEGYFRSLRRCQANYFTLIAHYVQCSHTCSLAPDVIEPSIKIRKWQWHSRAICWLPA